MGRGAATEGDEARCCGGGRRGEVRNGARERGRQGRGGGRGEGPSQRDAPAVEGDGNDGSRWRIDGGRGSRCGGGFLVDLAVGNDGHTT
jgi:hypothetical protein